MAERAREHAEGLLAELAQALQAVGVPLIQPVVLFQRLEQADLRLQAMGVPALRQLQAMCRSLLHFGRGLQLQRVVLRAEKAGVGAGVDDAVVPDRPRNGDRRRQVARRLEVRDHAAHRGKIAAVAAIARHGQRVVHLAGQRVIDAHLVLVAGMRVRADDRQLVRVPGDLRQLIANLNARNHRRDRLELAADAVGGLGLEIERVLLRRPAPEIDQDARLGRWPPPGAAASWACQQTRNRQRPQPDLAQANHRVTSVQHRTSPWRRRAGTLEQTLPQDSSLSRGLCCIAAEFF